MKTLFILTLALLMTNANAANLDNVKILDIKQEKENFSLKLQDSSGAKDSYFFVDIVPEDKEAFAKLALVLKKIKLKEKFKLALVIPSFSASPSGSYYRSNGVMFKGSAAGESLLK